MKKHSGPILHLLVFIAAFLFWGCGQNGAAPNDAFVVGLEGNPTTMDPRFASDAYSSRIRPLIFDSLIEVAPDGTFTPNLAESWEQRDKTTFVFHIKKGVTFHDGRPLTSRDVKYTFDYLMDPKNKCPAGGSLGEIESVLAPDPYTVEFRLSKVFVPVMFKLVKGIVPAHLGDADEFSDNPVGSGPYRVVNIKRGEIVELAANDQYHDGVPLIKKLRFEVVRSDTTRMLKLEKGELHLVLNAVAPYAIKFFERTKGIQVIRQPGVNYSYLGFNLKDKKGITDKVSVRRAIAHAIDREKIVKALMKGQAQLAGGLLAPSNHFYCGDVMTYDFDPEKARSLLDQAGFTDPDGDGPQKRFTLSYKTSTNKLRNRIAEIMAVQLGDVGIGVEKRSYEWGTFYDDIKKGNFQSFTLTWVGITDPDIYHYIFHSSQQPPIGANRGRYENPTLDALLDQTWIETDDAARKDLFCRIQQIVADDCVYVSLWWAEDIVVATKGLKGFYILPGGEYTPLAKATWDKSGEI